MFALNVLLFMSWALGLFAVTIENNRCNGNWSPLLTTVNTTQRLESLREVMREYNITAYFISTNDDHQSEYVAAHDMRREFISGFTGSAGEAVVTLESAALWTDSRYYIQAEEQLDCNWVLMRTGESSTPSNVVWLSQQLSPGDEVSADPKTIPYSTWERLRVDLEKNDLAMRGIAENLVDFIWLEEDGRPPYPNASLTILDVKYAGLSWQDKIENLREIMVAKTLDTIILTALDEISWLLNLRGGDIPFTPVFRSYFVLTKNQSILYVPEDKVTSAVEIHLNSNGNGTEEVVSIKDYNEFWGDLSAIGAEASKIGLPSPYSYAQGVSYLVHIMVPLNKIIDLTSPVLLLKDTKNVIEAEGMRQAHVRDAVALCVFLARLERNITAGDTSWTELRAVKTLDDLRREQPLSQGPSFATIAASGINAALPHYEPSEDSDKNITNTELFMVDSGGQYLDGTTDVTRTVHFGEPRPIEKAVYTKLLMGCIDIVTATFPEGQTLSSLEILIRRPLYELGLDYGHGSTHGIGSFLVVHEAFNTTYHVGFFGSQEPGYYKENDFGMRLENIVTVVPANTMSGEKNFLTFEAVTLVPYEPKLIDITALDQRHITWLNSYNNKILTLVGKLMVDEGYTDEYNWLIGKTKPIL